MAASEVVATEAPRTDLGELAGKYLTFHLGHEEFGIGILKVREIIGLMDITSVPRTPDYVRGVINLRGKVISVVDLRTKFGMPTVEDTAQSCVIVVEVQRPDGKMPIGILVDEVSEVRDIVAEQIDATPQFGATVHCEFLLGMGKIGQSVVMLLDIDRILSSDEVSLLETIEH